MWVDGHFHAVSYGPSRKVTPPPQCTSDKKLSEQVTETKISPLLTGIELRFASIIVTILAVIILSIQTFWDMKLCH